MTKHILATTALATLLATGLQAQTAGGTAAPSAGGATMSQQETVSPGSGADRQPAIAQDGGQGPAAGGTGGGGGPLAQDGATMPSATTSNDAGTITNPAMTNEGPEGMAEEAEPALDQATTTEEGTGATGNAETTAPPATDESVAGSAQGSGTASDPAAEGAAEGALTEKGWSPADLGAVSTERLMGAEIVTHEDEAIATIEDVLISDAGKVEGVVARFGGFLGFGSNRVRLEADEVEIMRNEGDELMVRTSLTPESIEGRPEYQDAAE